MGNTDTWRRDFALGRVIDLRLLGSIDGLFGLFVGECRTNLFPLLVDVVVVKEGRLSGIWDGCSEWL